MVKESIGKSIRHVAVNARLLLPHRLEGIGRFTDEVVQRWVQAHPDVQFSFFFDRPFDARFCYGPNVKPYVLFPQARHPFLYLWWFEWSVARMLRRLQPDVFFSSDCYLSLSSSIPQVGVLHDLAFVRYASALSPIHRWHYDRYFPRYVAHAKHLLTVSQFSRNEILSHYQLPPEKVTVVHNGSSAVFQPSDAATQAATRQQYAQGKPYLLYVGAIQPRKNVEQVLLGFDHYKTTTGADTQLVIAGRKAWNYAGVEAIYQQMKHGEDVRFTGYVDDRTLNALYGSAIALVYLSHYEGFGLPILEAMYAETAIIAAQAASLPEVGGDAAVYVPTNDTGAVAQAMTALASNPMFREGQIAAGRIQRQRFSWAKTAETAWQAIKQALRA
jgi:glycosyltransferase involved in cell wall biosynthesis